MTVKEKFAEIKKILFDTPPAPQAPAPSTTAPAPVSAPAPLVVSYPVDGGQPVYVNCADDGIPDIDANDPVFTDALMSAPYPDGTYTVTGTDFGFTVSAGLVSAVTDADGTGPGAPLDAAAAAPVAPAAPVYAAPTPTPAPVVPVTQSQMDSQKERFDTEIGQVKTELETVKTELAEAKTKSEKYEQVVKDLFELVGKIVEMPVTDPVTLVGNKKEKFERAESREAKLDRIAKARSQALKELKAAK
jgi:hypothetical protein